MSAFDEYTSYCAGEKRTCKQPEKAISFMLRKNIHCFLVLQSLNSLQDT